MTDFRQYVYKHAKAKVIKRLCIGRMYNIMRCSINYYASFNELLKNHSNKKKTIYNLSNKRIHEKKNEIKCIFLNTI